MVRVMGDKKSENLKRRRSVGITTPSSRPSKRAKIATSAPTLPSTSATQGICNAFPFSAVWDPSKSQFNARLIPLPNGALSLAAQPRSETFVSEIMKNVVGGAQLNASVQPYPHSKRKLNNCFVLVLKVHQSTFGIKRRGGDCG